jgi:hypothetical protein
MKVLAYGMVVVMDKLAAIQWQFNRQTNKETNNPTKLVSNPGSYGSLVLILSLWIGQNLM